MSNSIYYKFDELNSPPCPCNENQISHPPPKLKNPNLPYQQQPYGLLDTASYAQVHRRLEAMQHAMQSQVFRKLSGF